MKSGRSLRGLGSVARSGGGEPGEVGVCSGEKRNESMCVTMEMEAEGVQIPGGQLSAGF